MTLTESSHPASSSSQLKKHPRTFQPNLKPDLSKPYLVTQEHENRKHENRTEEQKNRRTEEQKNIRTEEQENRRTEEQENMRTEEHENRT